MSKAGWLAGIAWLGVALALRAETDIERVDCTYTWEFNANDDDPGIAVLGEPKTFRFAGGRTAPEGGSLARCGVGMFQKTERVGSGFRYIFSAPENNIALSFISVFDQDYFAGKILVDGPIELMAPPGSTSAVFSIRGRVAPPDRLNAQPGVKSHFPALPPGSQVTIHSTWTSSPWETGPLCELAFSYYPDGLRASKTVYAWTGRQPIRRHRYAYDRSCLIYEAIEEWRQGVRTTWDREYLWGMDVADQASGAWRQEAGGVGGLVAVKIRRGGQCRILAPLCDEYGNVVKLFDPDRQKLAADFTYTPFGETVGVWADEPSPAEFPLRLRSQYCDVETGLFRFPLLRPLRRQMADQREWSAGQESRGQRDGLPG